MKLSNSDLLNKAVAAGIKNIKLNTKASGIQLQEWQEVVFRRLYAQANDRIITALRVEAADFINKQEIKEVVNADTILEWSHEAQLPRAYIAWAIPDEFLEGD